MQCVMDSDAEGYDQVLFNYSLFGTPFVVVVDLCLHLIWMISICNSLCLVQIVFVCDSFCGILAYRLGLLKACGMLLLGRVWLSRNWCFDMGARCCGS